MIENIASKRIANIKGFVIFFYIECCFFFNDLEMFFRLKFFYGLQENNSYNYMHLIDKPELLNPEEAIKAHPPHTAHKKSFPGMSILAEQRAKTPNCSSTPPQLSTTVRFKTFSIQIVTSRPTPEPPYRP